MKRLASFTTTSLLVCFLGFIGIGVAVIVTRIQLRSVYSMQPTPSNSEKFTTADDRTYYAPPYLVRRRTVLNVACGVSLGLVFLLSLGSAVMNDIVEKRERPRNVPEKAQKAVASTPLARATSVTILLSVLCLFGVGVAINVNHSRLRAVATTQPTASNPSRFTSNDHSYFGPANLVRRQTVLNLLIVLLLLVLLFAVVAFSVIKGFETRKRRIELRQKQGNIPPPPDFIIESGSISWVIPRAAKRAVIRSPHGWGPYLFGGVIAWVFFDLLFHFHPDDKTPPELTATACAFCMVPVYFLSVLVILGWTSVVTLDDEGIAVQLAGKKGRRSTRSYRSISGCGIEQSRWVPGLPCLTFKVPGRVRSEKTLRWEMPGSADVGAVVEFLSKRGVVCSDNR